MPHLSGLGGDLSTKLLGLQVQVMCGQIHVQGHWGKKRVAGGGRREVRGGGPRLPQRPALEELCQGQPEGAGLRAHGAGRTWVAWAATRALRAWTCEARSRSSHYKCLRPAS
jgi:hypothetical protein